MQPGECINYNYCPACKTIQQYPLPSQEQLSKLVSREYSNNDRKLTFNKEQSDSLISQHKAIVAFLKQSKITMDVLDVGAGAGNLCSMLIRNGIECTGIELSPELVAHAKKRKLPVLNKGLKDIPDNESFSAILMTHVFEHLTEPEEPLYQIKRLLKPNGLFLSIQPTAGMTNFLSRLLRLNNLDLESPFSLSYLSLNPWHIAIYSINGMETLANRCGFEMVDVIPMASLKNTGIIGLLRTFYNTFNKAGEKIFPKKWPFHVAHLFIFKKQRIPSKSGAFRSQS
jgi:SAM-dependent methyltransferase